MTDFFNFLNDRKKLKLDFSQENAGLPANVTFSRPSAALRTNSLGVIASVAADVTRFDFDPVSGECLGVLIETTQTNLLPYSVFYTAHTNPYGVGYILQSVVTAPDESMTGMRTSDGTGTGPHYVFTEGISVVSGKQYCASVFAKAGTASTVQLTLPSTRFSGPQFATFDIFSGVFLYSSGASNAKIENYGNGWFRLSAVFTCSSSGSGGLHIGFGDPLVPSTRLPSYTGTSSFFHLWGAQVELGSALTSHIPTNGAAATRAADQLSFTIPIGIKNLVYTFDDNSTQTVSASAGIYTVPTTLDRKHVLKIQGT